MDKQTLSQYGWIVVAMLVIVVMIAFATPFSKFVGNAIFNIARANNEILEYETTEGYDEKSEYYKELFGNQNGFKTAGLYQTEDGRNYYLVHDWDYLCKTSPTDTDTNKKIIYVSGNGVKTNYNKTNSTNISSSELDGNIVLKTTIQTIPEDGFRKCENLQVVTFNNIYSIQKNAFKDCKNLQYLFFDKNTIKYIFEGAFTNCNKLEAIKYNGTMEEFKKIQFGSQNISQYIYVVCNDGVLCFKFNNNNNDESLDHDGNIPNGGEYESGSNTGTGSDPFPEEVQNNLFSQT